MTELLIALALASAALQMGLVLWALATHGRKRRRRK